MMLNCPECLAHKWLIFAPTERMVCADCGYTYPADEAEDPGQAMPDDPWENVPEDDGADLGPAPSDWKPEPAVVGGQTLRVYFQRTSNDKTMAYTWDGVHMTPISVVKAEQLIDSGEAVQMLQHPRG